MSNETKSGWGLTRNHRGVRRVIDANRDHGTWWSGWRDSKGYIEDGAFFDAKADAIKFARRHAEAALKNAEKQVANAKRDLAKLDKIAAQPE